MAVLETLHSPEDFDQQILIPRQMHLPLEVGRLALAPTPDDKLIGEGEILNTPIDDRGVVIEDKLIELVMGSVREDYLWRGEPDVHHLYWKSDWYNQANFFNQDSLRLHSAFRELPVHKVYLPREFHDYLHTVTTPIEPPSLDVMHDRVEGWNVAVRLFKDAGDIDRTLYLADNRREDIQKHPEKIRTEEDEVAADWYISTMRKHFRGIYHRKGELERVPDEFRFVEPELIETFFDNVKPNEIDPNIVNEFRQRVRWIGSIAKNRAVYPSIDLHIAS